MLIGCGDDGMTTEIEGFQSGDELNFFVLKQDASIYSLTAEFLTGSPIVYAANGIEVVSSLFLSDLFASGCADEEVLGCLDPIACNYNENATNDDGSCTYAVEGICEECSGETDGTGIIIIEMILILMVFVILMILILMVMEYVIIIKKEVFTMNIIVVTVFFLVVLKILIFH